MKVSYKYFEEGGTAVKVRRTAMVPCLKFVNVLGEGMNILTLKLEKSIIALEVYTTSCTAGPLESEEVCS